MFSSDRKIREAFGINGECDDVVVQYGVSCSNLGLKRLNDKVAGSYESGMDCIVLADVDDVLEPIKQTFTAIACMSDDKSMEIVLSSAEQMGLMKDLAIEGNMVLRFLVKAIKDGKVELASI